jgi:hypothetical protein
MAHRKFTITLAAALMLAVGSGAALGATLFSETFDGAFKITGAGHSVRATGGQYVVTGTGPNVASTYELPGPGAAAAFAVSTQVGTDPGAPGSFNVGLVLGNNRVVFHPGFGGGALRVEGAGGFGNQNVGYTPALGVLHTLTVSGDGAGNFSLTLKDGTAVNPDFNAAWSNAGNPLTTIGTLRNGNTTVNGLFDNLSVPPAAVETFSSDFSAQVTGRVEATGGQLTMQGAGTSFLTYPGQAGDLLISGEIGSAPGSGNTNVGIRVGANNIVFHPAHGGGALRAEGPNGFGNQNMGFTPAGGVLHTMDLAVNAATGQVTIAVTDANNPSTVYAARFTNAGYAPGTDQIGFKYGSGTGGDAGQYDNLQISQLLQSTDGQQSWVNQIQADNPRHWYRLNETGSKIAIDSGSAALHGVYQNGVTQGVGGKTNGAARFDGANDKINLGAANLAGPWTAEFIVSKLGQEPSGILLGNNVLPGARTALKLDQWNNTGQVGFTWFGVADWFFNPAFSAPLDEFIQLVYVGDPTTGLSLYANGTLVGTNPNYVELPLFEIGSFEPANMVLDEVVIFDRALSASEVHAHALAADVSIIPEPVTLVLAAMGLASLGSYVRRRRKA